MNKNNRILEAFKEGYNTVGLAGAAALSAVTLNPLPLLVGLVAEAAYLLFVPDSRWYLKRLSRRSDAEIAARRLALKAQIFPNISGVMRQRFERLEAIRTQLGSQNDLGEQDWFRQVVRRLDYLLEKFLMFASKEATFRAYLTTVRDEMWAAQGRLRPPDRDDEGRVMVNDRRASRKGNRGDGDARGPQGDPGDRDSRPEDRGPNPEWAAKTVRNIQEFYADEVTEIGERSEAEDDPSTKMVLAKRVEVLEQRKEYVGKIGKILTNLCHQMDLLADSFGLINDQVRARPPEQVLADIEGVVYQTDSMTKLLEELAPLESGNTFR